MLALSRLQTYHQRLPCTNGGLCVRLDHDASIEAHRWYPGQVTLGVHQHRYDDRSVPYEQ